MGQLDFNALPIEILERIVEKCAETDNEGLDEFWSSRESRDKPQLKRSSSQNPDDEGWETEQEDDEDDDDNIPELIDDDGCSKQGKSNADAAPRAGCVTWGYCHGCKGEHVDPVSEADKNAMEGPILAISALSLVSKTTRKLVLPWLYNRLDFQGIHNEAVQRWIDIIMPLHGQYVKKFWMRVNPEENRDYMDIAEGDERLWRTFARLKLALRLLDSLDNLESIDIDIIEPQREAGEVFEPEEAAELQQIRSGPGVPGAIKRHAAHLQRLAITAEGSDPSYVTSPIWKLLSLSSNLTSLELNAVDFERGQESEILSAVASLANLRHLELSDVQAVNDSWSKVKWPPLRSLLLEECLSLTDGALDAWITAVSGSLQQLTIEDSLYEGAGALNNGPVYDMPQLRFLYVEQPNAQVTFLERFAMCPRLKRMEVGNLDEVDARTLQNMITKYRSESDAESAGFPGLKELYLTNAWPMAEEDSTIESLELVCFANNITLEIEPPDSDDDDDDDEDSENLSYGDGYDMEEGWEEGFTDEEDVEDDEAEEDLDDID